MFPLTKAPVTECLLYKETNHSAVFLLISKAVFKLSDLSPYKRFPWIYTSTKELFCVQSSAWFHVSLSRKKGLLRLTLVLRAKTVMFFGQNLAHINVILNITETKTM